MDFRMKYPLKFPPSLLSDLSVGGASSGSTVDTQTSVYSFESDTSGWRDKVYVPNATETSLTTDVLSDALCDYYDPDFEGHYNHQTIDEGTAYLCTASPFVDAFEQYYSVYPEQGQAYQTTWCSAVWTEEDTRTEPPVCGYLETVPRSSSLGSSSASVSL